MDRHIFRFDTEQEYKARESFDPPHIALTEDDNIVHYGSVEQNTIINGYEFVDLGLSVKWATCNIGATKPEEYGWYFQWGGTIPYNSDRTPVDGGDAITFSWNSDCPYWMSGTEPGDTKWSKYTAANSYSSTGVADNKLVLEPEDDAAQVHISRKCRMATATEAQELLTACNKTWVTNYNGTGINGCLLTLKSDQSKILFFPASGYLQGNNWGAAGSFGYCWSSSLSSSDSYSSCTLSLSSSGFAIAYRDRFYGRSIRAVLPS